MVGLVVSLHSASRRARAVAAERASELVTSKEGFRLLVENVQDYGIFALDRAGRVTTWNAGASAQPRLRSGGHRRKTFFHFLSPRGHPRPATPSACLPRRGRRGGSRKEGWRQRRDGSPFLGERGHDGAAPTGWHDGRLRGDRPRRDRAPGGWRRASRRRATRRFRGLAAQAFLEFLATMSHEIRHPR